MATLLAIGWTCPADAQGEAPPLDLSWHAPAECPTREEILSELERVATVQAGADRLEAKGVVERRGAAGYQLLVWTRRGEASGKTSVEAETCEPLARAATLILALAFGPDVALSDPGTAAPEAVAPTDPELPGAPAFAKPLEELQKQEELTPAHETHETHETQSNLTSTVELSLALTPSLLPQATGGVRSGVAVKANRWRALVQVTGWLPRSFAVSDEISARFAAAQAGVGACYCVLCEPVEVSACGLAQGGVLWAASQGQLEAGQAWAPWFALGPAVVLRWRLSGGVHFRAQLEGAWVPGRARFEIAGHGEVFQARPWLPTLATGLDFTL